MKSQTFFGGVFMNKFEVLNHEPSLLPDGEWRLVFSNEFVVDYVRVFDLVK